MTRILAFDLGATSARGIIYSLVNGNLIEEEIFRFKDYQIIDSDKEEIFWNMPKILEEIQTIIKLAIEKYKIESIGFDTWGCDFGLIKNGKLLSNPLCYQTMLYEKNQHYGADFPEKFQEITGIPNASINSSSQILYLKEHHPELLAQADLLLMMPDLIHYLLTRCALSETSIASTSQLFDIHKHEWSEPLLSELGISEKLFPTIVLPYTRNGLIKISNQEIPVYSVMEHDTASAIFALPTSEEKVYFLSSGTWSVLGQKGDSTVVLRDKMDKNFSYELAGDGKILNLKNLLGMWFIEEALKTSPNSIQEIQELLRNQKPLDFYFDNEDTKFLEKGKFVELLKEYGEKHGFDSLNSEVKLFQTIYQNLAFKYATTFADLMGQEKENIFLFGGGSKSDHLNQMIADLTGCDLTICHSESSGLGNAMAQLLALNQIRNRQEMVEIIKRYSQLKTYHPQKNFSLQEKYCKYQTFIESEESNELS